MSKIIATWLVLFVEMVLMFTPIMFYIDGMHREAANTILNEGAKKAAIEGELTNQNKQEMINEMATTYNHDEDDIEITWVNGTGQKVTRGDFIELEMSVPRNVILALDVFAPGALNNEFKSRVRIMSEFQDNSNN